MEFWCDAGDDLWRHADIDLGELVVEEITRSGLLGEVEITDSHVERIPNTHPAYPPGYSGAIGAISDRLATVGTISIVGRHGQHGVLGMGESMDAAKAIADDVVRTLATS